MKDKARAWLQERGREVFTKVDDSLFGMAEKAHTQEEQDGLFQALRLLRVERNKLAEKFVAGVEQRFYSAQRDSLASEEEPLDLDNLALVHNDDLEQQVAIKTMVAGAKRDLAEPIAELSLRLDTLLPAKIYDENMPLAPGVICGAFMETVRPLDVHLRARLTLLKKFEQLLVARLRELYEICNLLMVESGVLPSLKDPLRQRRMRNPQIPANGAPVPAAPGPADAAGAGDPLAGFVPPVSVMNGPGAAMSPFGTAAAVSGASGFMPTVPPAGLPGSFVSGAIPGGAVMSGSGQFAPGLLPASTGVAPMPTHDLLQHLGQMQIGLPLQVGAGGQLLNVGELLQQRLVQASQSASLHELDDEVIRLVDMLFSFMLEDRNLAEPIKTQLIRLQLPLLKLAVADKSFFTKGGHPARKLLNELADAAIGWQPGENFREEPLYREICHVVEGVLREFDRDEDVFAHYLESFRGFFSRERKRAEVMERRTVDEAQGQARVEAAKARVAAVFDALTAERNLPKVVYEWLNRVWNSVLFRTCLKEGTDSAAWRQNVLTARDLIWSVVAPMPESSVKLKRLLPDLRRRLDEGAQSLSLGAADRQRLMQGLDALYRERQALGERVESERERRTRERLVQELLREADSVIEIPDVVADEPELPAGEPELPRVEELQQVVAQVESQLQPAEPELLKPMAESDTYWRQTYHLKDSWFLLCSEDKSPVRCRLAAIIHGIDQFMFVNRAGSRVVTYNRLEFAHALRDKRLEPLEKGPLFERALQYVIGNIGESKIAMSVES